MSCRRLSEIADVVMGQSPTGDHVSPKPNGLPLLNGPTEFGPVHPVPVQWTDDPKKRSQSGDLLFCVRGSTTGRMNWADQEYAIGRGLAAIRGKGGFRNSFIRAIIECRLPSLLALSSGSTFPNVSRADIESIEVAEISMDDALQASLLIESIDDKIANNRALAADLEAMARAIFKSWFVDFDPVKAKMEGRVPTGMNADTAALFSDELVESELGLIPKGWDVVELGSLCELITKGTTPSKSHLQGAVDAPSIRFIKVKDITDSGEIQKGGLEEIPQSIHDGPLKRSILNEGDILFSIAGTIGRVAHVDDELDKANTNQAVGIIRLSNKELFLDYVLIALRGQRIQDDIAAQVTQGVQANTSLRNLREIQLLLPSPAILEAARRLITPAMRMVRHLQRESADLANLRDALLPRLISGKLRLPG